MAALGLACTHNAHKLPRSRPQGNLIAESGTMSGGGGKPRGGRICLGKQAPKSVDTRAAAAELERAEAELKQQTAAHQQARRKADEASSALKQAEKQLTQQEAELPRAQMELAADKEKAKDLQQRLQELQAATQVSCTTPPQTRMLALHCLESSPQWVAVHKPHDHTGICTVPVTGTQLLCCPACTGDRRGGRPRG